MSARPIDFWFSIGSTYTYLSVMRLPALAAREGLTINWRPFSVRALMIEQDNIPFAHKPLKQAYMWRDVSRRAERYGFPARLPAPYPLRQWDLANRLAVLAARDGWCDAFAVETYRRWFQQGQEPAVEPHLSATLASIGRAPAETIAAAQSPAIEDAYRAATDAARAAGLFGAPTFVVDGELF